MSKKTILKIALPSPLRTLFDYLLPEALLNDTATLKPGYRVEVPFGKQRLTGLIIAIEAHSDIEPGRLKPILALLDEEASLPEELLQLALWSANYYQHPIGEVIFHLLPNRLREPKTLLHKHLYVWQPSQKALLIEASSLGRANLQAKALRLLQEHPKGLNQETCIHLGVTTATLKALEKKDLACLVVRQKAEQQNFEQPKPQMLRSSHLSLNTEQKTALQEISKALNYGFQSFLLYGITGSGKTEVYLQAIEQVLNEGKQALVLVPEIGLTPQTLLRFQERFTCPIATLHSGLSDLERYKHWYQARSQEAKIIIGTRSAIFADIPKLGLIVVDEEHDPSYKQQEGFRYSARDLALIRAREKNIPVILGSATPSLETLHNVQQGRYQLLKLTQRATHIFQPAIKLLDIRKENLQSGLAQKTLQHIRHHLDRQQQVLVFINRRGYTPALICGACHWLASCPFCDARFTYHKGKNRLICHHCNYQQALITQCPQCHHGEMHMLGQGTEKVEELLQKHFKKIPVLRIDRDSTEKKNAFSQGLKFILKGEPCILVGTQMLTKGHHFPKVSMVCIIDADQGFFSADFRALERMSQTLVQIAGRSGREIQDSEVLLQTAYPDHPGLQVLVREGYLTFAELSLKERQVLKFPPYAYLVLIRADAIHIEQSVAFLEQVKSLLVQQIQLAIKVDTPSTKSFQNIKLLGPAPAPMQKRAGRHRAQLLLKSESRSALQALLKNSIPLFSELPENKKVRWSIDVDPLELF